MKRAALARVAPESHAITEAALSSQLPQLPK